MPPIGKEIPGRPVGRRLVIPDIHGCVKTLSTLIDTVEFNPTHDQLYFLGDYVNKGPSSLETLDFLIELSSNDSVHCLMGNHDLMILNHLIGSQKISNDKLVKLYSSVFDRLNESTPYIDFLSNLAYYISLDDYILVHAGLNMDDPQPLICWEEMLTIVGFRYDANKVDGKTIVHGHLPHPLHQIEESINLGKSILPMDNGCVYLGERLDQGNLLCYDLDSKVLFKQEKID